jgi:tetratricopeptide (TPR) repeat protein
MIAIALQAAGKYLAPNILRSLGQLPEFSSDLFASARYYFVTGQPEKAIGELTPFLPKTDSPTLIETDAKNDYDRIIFLRSNPLGQLAFWALNLSWSWPSTFVIAAITLCLIAIIFYVVRIIGPHPLFVVMPFVDYADLNLSDDLPAMILSRMREIAWQKNNLPNTQRVITENLDIPSLGLVNEGGTLDTIALLETALLFSTGINDFPLARLVNSLRLWAEQPKYLVSGSFEKANDKIWISFQLRNRKKGSVEQAWNCEIDACQSRRAELIDNILFPLLFHFSKELGTKKWDALLASHAGLEAFQSYVQYQERTYHLELAKNYLEQAVHLDPAYGLAHYNLGIVHLTAGEYDKARERFMDAMRLAKEAAL